MTTGLKLVDTRRIAAYPTHGDNSEDLIHAADEALYRAKKAGRDCIIVCEPLESSPKSADKTI